MSQMDGKRVNELRALFRFVYYLGEAIQSTPALRTPRYYGHPTITDSSKIPGESYRRLTEKSSCCYGLSLLRTYGHFIRSQRHNFLVFFSRYSGHRAASWNICTHIRFIFSAFWDSLCLFWSISDSSVQQSKFCHLFLLRPSLQSRCRLKRYFKAMW